MESHEDRKSGPKAKRPEQNRRDGKIRRMAADVQGIVEDLQKWIDLRLDLAVLEVEERLDRFRNELALGLTLAIIGFFAALFTLTTLALGVGWLLGRPFWGFLAVSVFLILVVSVLQAAKPDLLPPSKLFESVRGERNGRANDGHNGGTKEASSGEEETSEAAASS